LKDVLSFIDTYELVTRIFELASILGLWCHCFGKTRRCCIIFEKQNKNENNIP